MSDRTAILQMLRECRFDDVTPIVIRTLRDAAAESPQRLAEVARDVVRWRGFFKNNAEAMTSESYFRAVHSVLLELAGADSPVTVTAADNLAGLLGSIGKVDEAISLREEVVRYMSSRLPSDDQRLLIVRDGLAVLYRRAGREDRLAELYAMIGI